MRGTEVRTRRLNGRDRRWGAAVLAVLAAVGSATASVILPPQNLGELARQSEQVLLAVAGESWSEERGAELVTVTPFAVLETVKGFSDPGDLLEVEVPGGEREDGTMLVIEGAPRFTPGATYLLPLAPARDGRWQPTMLAYGILQRLAGASSTLLAPLPEATALTTLPRPDGAAEGIGTYRERELLDHLARVARGAAAWDREAVEAPAAAGTHAEAAPPGGCAWLVASNGKPMRWKVFDSGGSVSVVATRGGDPTVPGGALTELQQAIADWDGVPATSIALRYQGEKDYRLSCSSSFDTPKSGTNVVVFSDPCHDLADLSSCAGLVAYGGAWASGTHTYGGVSYNSITSLYVVVNNGISCLSSATLRAALEHELGHGLGFGHTSDPTSVMYPYVGNTMNETDLACAQYLYSAVGDRPPAAPTQLAASDGTFSDRVQLTWKAVTGAVAYTVTRRGSDGEAEFGPIASPAWDDTTALPGERYTFTVRAVNAFGSSAPSAADEGFRAPELAALEIVAPSAAASGVAYTVSWTAVAGVSSYELEEATEPSFAAPTVTVTSDTSMTFVHQVNSPQTFYYRVRPRVSWAAATENAAPPSNVVATTVSPSLPTGHLTARVGRTSFPPGT
jgi:hypothetical protein